MTNPTHDPDFVRDELQAVEMSGADHKVKPDVTEWCQTEIWPSWANRWVKCGSQMKNGKCAMYGHGDGPTVKRVTFTDEQIRQHDAEVAATAKSEAHDEWVQHLAQLCDDDWLRRRDRCMHLPGASSRHDRSAAGAWEHAAHMVRRLLNEHGYEDEYVNRHAAYLAWMNGGRDQGEQECADRAEAAS